MAAVLYSKGNDSDLSTHQVRVPRRSRTVFPDPQVRHKRPNLATNKAGCSPAMCNNSNNACNDNKVRRNR